jgi:hypothetical protein
MHTAEMTVLRHAAAGIAVLAALVLGAAAVLAIAIGGLVLVGCVYAATAALLARTARRLRPRRRRGSGYLPLSF